MNPWSPMLVLLSWPSFYFDLFYVEILFILFSKIDKTGKTARQIQSSGGGL